MENNEVLLRVEGLCQYFRSKNGYENKAVDNVSFDIKKGEVFGLVGESGCGKTTTGRSIIRIYDITSGSIYFKGQRVCAGTRSYTNAIKAARKETAEKIKVLKGVPGSEAQIAQLKADLAATVEENRKAIKAARFDHLHSDKEYAKKLVKEVDE
ncbi:MAG: ATP-binding cassette domain-containing protein [Oscillospiraceae bacterium]|nr:ATP-binding cassette domain-containing protein [Oscillospiraceae bacterium]